MGKTLNLIIEESYEVLDKDYESDVYEIRLFNKDDNECIMRGDWYHNKIDSKIKGFCECLNYLDIGFNIETRKVNETKNGDNNLFYKTDEEN